MINMKQESIYNVANQKLQDFVNNHILDYERQRNRVYIKNSEDLSVFADDINTQLLEHHQ